ncbi:MAG: hypothetical protein HY297_04130 [Thaumarchaeota archaeon]|nr:hypothetical protein [Nitrososphaerota archaeon]
MSIVTHAGLPTLADRLNFYGPYGQITDATSYSMLIVTTLVTIFGMVLMPYFGAASLIAEDRSVWRQTVMLIQQHISFPFVGGVALFYSGFALYQSYYFGGGLQFEADVLIGYILFVVTSTLLVYMSSRPVREAAVESAAANMT